MKIIRSTGGWYIFEGFSARPLGGPFVSQEAGEAAWHASQRRSGRYGFTMSSSLLYEPLVILRPEHLIMGIMTRVDSFTKLECGDGLFLGDYVHIASHCHLGIGGGTLIFEEGSSAASGCRVMSGSATMDAPSCSATHPSAVNIKTTTYIGKNVSLFANVVVAPGCTIGEGARLYPGAVLPANTIVGPGEHWAGVPARRKR